MPCPCPSPVPVRSCHDGGREELLAEVKFTRRLARLRQTLGAAERVLFLFVGPPARNAFLTVNGVRHADHMFELEALGGTLHALWPDLAFHILAFNAAKCDLRGRYVTNKFVPWPAEETAWESLALLVAKALPGITVNKDFIQQHL